MKEALTFLLILQINSGLFSQNLDTETLFKRYLISESESIAQIIVKDTISPYRLYCEAMLEEDIGRQVSFLTEFIDLNAPFGRFNAYMNRGIRYAMTDRDSNAITDLTKAIDLDPNVAFCYYFRALSFMNLDRYQEAIKGFNKTVELDNSFHLIYLLRGQCYFEKKDYDLALKDYNLALKYDRKNEQALRARGSLFCAIEEYKKAIKDWKKAISLNASNKNSLEPMIEEAESKLN